MVDPLRNLAPLAIGFLVAGIAASFGQGAWAAEIQIESPSFEFDPERNAYKYNGARIQIEDLVLEADEVTIELDSASLVARGRVRFQDGSISGAAERIELHTESGIAKLFNAEIFDADNGYYIRAETLIRVEPKHYKATQCTLTSCSPKDPAWRIEAAEMDYRQDDFAVTYNTTLRLGDVPVLWAPAFAWPTVQKRRTGFLAPNLSTTTESKERLSTGTRISVPFFLSLGVDQDLTLTPEHYTERGTALRLGYRYAFVEDQKGRLKFWGIPETAPRNFSGENQIPSVNLDEEDRTRNRFWSQWGHNQGFGGNTRFISDVAQASDGQVLREYERVREYRPSLDFQASVSHQAAWGHGAVTAEHASEYTEESIFADGERFTDGGVRPQLLPRASYNGGVQFGRELPLGLELAATVTRFLTDEGASGRAETAAPAISLPIRLIGSLEFRPTIERRFVRYAELDVAGEVFEEPAADRPAWLKDAESLRSEEGFAQTETEFELRAPFARVFLPESGSWSALKHRVTPRLILREIEDVPQPLAGLLVRPEPALKLLTFRLDNALFGKRGEDSAALPKKIATLNLIQRYNLLLEDEDFVPDGPLLPSPGETDPGEPLLPAILEGSYSGTGYDLSAFLRYHHQLDRIVEYRLGLGGSVSPRGRLRLTYTENVLQYRTPEAKLHPAVNTLRLNGALTAHDDLSFTFNGTVNLRKTDIPLDRRLTLAVVSADYHPGCYGIRLTYIERVDVTREFNAEGNLVDDFFIDRQILLTFNLGGLVTAQQGFVLPAGGQ